MRARQLIRSLLLEGHCPVRFVNGSQYCQSILKSTAIRPISIWAMTNPSTFKARIYLYDESLWYTSIANKNLSSTCTYVTETSTSYILPKKEKAWTVLALSVEKRPISNIISFYPMFDRKGNLSRYFQGRKKAILEDSRPLI